MLPKDTLVLDLGSYEIKGMFFDEKSDTIISSRDRRTGIENGYISNVFLFQTSVLNVIRGIELKTGKKITNVVLLLSGKILDYKVLSVEDLKVNGVIDQYKIDVFFKKVKLWVEKKNSILIKFFPIEYILDNYKIENPYGLYTDYLSFKYFICYCLKAKINNLIYVLEQLNLNVIDLIPSIFMLADRYLTDDEKRLGSIIFDVGHSKIHWCFYYKGVPIKAGNFNLGSGKITSKIARSLKISLEQATRIKHEHLSAYLKPDHFCAWITLNRESNEEFILQSEVVRKVLPEITTFVEEIKKTVDFLAQKNAYYVVLCGNGSYLNDLVPYLQRTGTIQYKTISQDDIFGVCDILFKHLKNETITNKIIKTFKRFFNYFNESEI